jgi:PKD repeat protein
MVVKRSLCVTLLLIGCMGGVSHLAWAQAAVDFTVTPASATVCAQLTFTAIVTEGDPTWFVLYEWDFNQDGTYEAAGRVVSYAFTTAGTKPVTLRAKDDRGGYYPVTKSVVVVNGAPTACFTYSPAYPDAGEPVQFDASCSTDVDPTPCGGIALYTWTFSDGGTATGRSVRHAFNEAGTQLATLTVQDNGGATDSLTKSIAIRCVKPIANFTYSPQTPTVNDEIAFQDLSTDPDGGTILAWNWSFGDGGTSTLRQPRHQYPNGGTYIVTLIVTDNCEKTDTKVVSITVAGPAAAFTYTPINPSTQDTVQFFDGSTGGADAVASRGWVFGDGAVSAAQNPTHRFSVPGTYRVQLTITTDHGATSSAERMITVLNAPPNAAFTFAPASPKVGQMVTFSAGGSGDPDGTVVMYEWDFNGDGLTDATGSSATRGFDVVGARPVMLTVTDDDGAKDSVTRVVPVQATPPTASFSFTPAEPYTGQVVTLNASASADADGTIILYEWDFDANGTPDATGMSVTRSFPSPGVYPVSLTVTDNDLAVDVETKGVPVEVGGTSGDNQPPVADFTFTPQEGDAVNLNEVVTFRADGASDPDGTIVSYEWDFDRDGRYDATGKVASYVYTTGGAKVVQLRVTDDDGAYGFKARVVSVEFVRPRAEFSYLPTKPEVGDVVTFDGSRSVDDDGTVEFYEWDFNNDGETDATGRTVNHVFTAGGSQPVTLIVTDNDGVTDLITKSVGVTVNAPPVAAIAVVTVEADWKCGTPIIFSDRSTDSDGRVTQWLWDFGDGGTSVVQTPSHTYSCTVARSYTVTMTVTDDHGATARATLPLALAAPRPEDVDFSWDPPNPVGIGVAVQFQFKQVAGSIAEGEVTGWLWDFGDGTTSTAARPTHSYTSSGGYTVIMEVELADGRTLTKEHYPIQVGEPTPLYAYPNPAARSATIVFELPSGLTSPLLRIFSLVGRALAEEDLAAGATTFVWDLVAADGEDVPNGLYFILVSGEDVDGRPWRSVVFKLLVVR